MSDRPLEAAAQALAEREGGWRDVATGEAAVFENHRKNAQACISAYLTALLRELPEEAVEAAARSLSDASSMDFATAWNFLHPPGALEAFLRALTASEPEAAGTETEPKAESHNPDRGGRALTEEGR